VSLRIFVLLLLVAALAYPQAIYQGGSDYGWFNCPNTYYNNVVNWDLTAAQTQIKSQLASMYANGQRVLRVWLWYMDGGDNCTTTEPLGTRNFYVNSTGGNLSAQCMSNLTGYLAAVKAAGFTGATFVFGPGGENLAQNWPTDWSTNQSYSAKYWGLLNEAWELIENVQPVALAAGLGVKIDLYNEGIPPANLSAYSGWVLYDQILWGWYKDAYGTANTVGYSFVGGTAAAANMLPVIYDIPYEPNQEYPPVFDIHLYPPTGQSQSYYGTTWTTLKSLGLTQGWIIGEAFYQDSDEASGLAAAQKEYGNTVYMLEQWPILRSNQGECLVPPYSFTTYMSYGW
jgi:hypothetical protein